MKRFFILLISLITLLVVLTGCSSVPSLELVNLSVDIVKDSSKTGSIVITEGYKKGQELVPTALYYEFTIKNTSSKSIGGTEKGKDLQIIILPNKNLEDTSKEIVGFNIYNPSSYVNSGVGHGSSFTPILKADQEGKFVLHYDLGVSEKDPQVPLLVPSAEKLKILKDNALDATLILMSGNNEITRFDLTKANNNK